MVNFVKEYWFGLLLFGIVLVFLFLASVIAVAPHNDAKMRGFTPCTYQMAVDLSQEEKLETKQVFKIINRGYMCYMSVIYQGLQMYRKKEQNTPWANYLFEPEKSDEADMLEDEDFSDDLLKANLFEDKEIADDLWENNKESVDESKE